MNFYVFEVPHNPNTPSIFKGARDLEVYAKTEDEARERLATFPGFTGKEKFIKIRWQ
jgi:hypothetical protein